MSDSWRPYGLYPPGPSVHGILQARTVEWGAISSSRDLPNPGMEPGSLAFQAGSVTCEPPRRPPDFIYIHTYININTHTHTHTYIYIHTHKGWDSRVSREGFPHPQDRGVC